MKLVFIHGWSFDASFWRPLHQALNQPDALFHDRGYGGAPAPIALPEEPYFLIGHSAGVLWALTRSLPACRGIIAFNGFSRFSQSEDFAPGIPKRVVTRMRSRLASAPEETVTQFRRQFEPFLPCAATLDKQALETGLTELLDSDGRDRAREWGRALTAIHGEQDPLISTAMHEASFPEATRLVMEGGHLLPVIAPHACAALIADILKAAS
ncbi:biotin synthase [Asaia spathodeae]|uniref:alpha/beta fold hydrolase n=1 Tax=Asaia spathodeae TaxID=657016 RepID=UPI002FC3D9BF